VTNAREGYSTPMRLIAGPGEHGAAARRSMLELPANVLAQCKICSLARDASLPNAAEVFDLLHEIVLSRNGFTWALEHLAPFMQSWPRGGPKP
jgi:hypothetical protein